MTSDSPPGPRLAQRVELAGTARVFLLSPASTSGRRAAVLFNPAARFDMAVRLRSGNATLGEVFAFLSGLYFRGKLAYAQRFAGAQDMVRIITSDRGLVPPDTPVTLEDLQQMSRGSIDDLHQPYRSALERDARDIFSRLDRTCSAILLGSIASDKYVGVLTEVLGERLVFPSSFVGRGDMSRGGLLLRCARAGQELDYAPVMTSDRRGTRPPKLDPTRDHHPSRVVKADKRADSKVRETPTAPSGSRRPARKRAATGRMLLPRTESNVTFTVDGREVSLTNLDKLFWPREGITKRDLLQYYLDVSDALLPHLRDRAMVMKRYPNGVDGKCFFMKRAPSPRPEWIELCTIDHSSGNIIDFPMIQDSAALLWVVNLGCIDLNQWYARCDDVDRPDYLHFDLDPVPGADFTTVLEAAHVVHDALERLRMPTLVKTTGSRGLHIYIPIVRGPTQKQVWSFAKAFANAVAAEHPALLTAVYRVADRPHGRVLVDYNQNAWGRTLASIYSPRPKPGATVSTPVTWDEVDRGIRIEDFTIATVPERVRELGDLWEPLLAPRGRFDLSTML